MKHRIPILLVIIMLIGSITSSANAIGTYQEKDLNSLYKAQGFEYKTLELETELQRLQLRDKNDQVKSLKKQMEQAEKDYKKNRNSKDEDKVEEYEKSYYSAVVAYYNGVKNQAQQTYNLDLKETNYDNYLAKIRKNFKSSVYNIVKQENNLDVLNQQLSLQKKQNDVSLKKLELNLVSKSTYEKQVLMENDLSLQQQMSAFNLGLAKKNLCFSLGIEEVDTFNIQVEQPVTESIDVQLEVLKKQFTKLNLDFRMLENDIKEQEKFLASIEEILPKGHEEILHGYNELNKSKNQLEKLVVDNQVYAVEVFYNFQNARDNYITSVEKSKVSAQQLNEMEVMHKNGQLSDVEFLGAELDYAKSQVQENNALLDYSLAIEQIALTLAGIK